MIDKPFGELEAGQRKTSRGRTVTETDVVNFCMLTGNWLEIHSNAEFAKRAMFGQRIVQGTLVFSIVNALLPFDPEVVEAFYGVDELRFHKPTLIGDTLWAQSEVIGLEDRGGRFGVATSRLIGFNQRRETVMSCQFKLLIRKTRLAVEPPSPAETNGVTS
ncbi:MaoC/PaaZ C-terminal domain-containing protein [Enterovirga sp.]|jgi:acyl dehydratase|uniref:MaoC/PaaZ C-terminal domain-containing protein n=1 Tax=Enterovirga sp. TaxID=2026350 RepID=UPI002635ED80|nr:MaoC/PaaZ C-terminal domain-containing protein [Enterovirga sp.]MDB5592448.1 MaoC domain protein dehydratase [Enterovirga sp.]